MSRPELEYRPEPEYREPVRPAATTGAASPSEDSTQIPDLPPTDFDALGRTVMRRKAMGEAAVRVAGRLAHAELLEEYSKTSDGVDTEPTAGADVLLNLLGDYLAAAGFDRPELHAKLSGQSIVIDLATPRK
ncbi:hypothetical protein [Rhodococcus sp. NPDC058521]|uniref:hypothetical protein n=1 Tax=Rhodococcus sp. NPDC058521 TaxID=3346536 RepID=UPI003662DEBD